MPLAETYFHRANKMLAGAWEANAAVVRQAAPVVGASVAAGGVVHTFGSGHSEIVAREIIGRAGGLVCVNGILDPTGGFVENLPGYGAKLVERYDRQYGLRAGEVAIVISNSGKNAAPIDVALYARERGLTVIGLTSLEMSGAVASQHPSGKKLFEVVDHVLDNRGAPGDAIVEIDSSSASPAKAGPTSTLIGCSLLNWLMLAAVDWLLAQGHVPPLLQSQNLPGAIEHNRALGKKYQGRLSRPLA
jgi:uncharacterized phosphosugar-binding protein